METCEICNKEFKTSRGLSGHIVQAHKISKEKYYEDYIKKENEGICLTCGNKTNFKYISSGYYDFCCNRCVQLNSKTQDKIKKTNLEKYGVDHFSKTDEYNEKVKQTSLEKFGKEYYFQTDEFKDQTKETYLKKYGVESHNKADSVKYEKEKSYLKNYGVKNPSKSDEIKKKKEEKTLENYGVDNVFKSDEIKLKIKQTNLAIYGFENPSKNEYVKDKTKATNLLRYGTEYILQNENNLEKLKKNNLIKYGVEWTTQVKEVRDKMNQTVIDKFYKTLEKYCEYLNIKLLDKIYINSTYFHNWLCLKCNNQFNSCWNYLQQGYGKCPTCYPITSGVSIGEKEIVDFLKSLNINNIVENSKQIIKPYELDIYLPDYNLAIEFNGLYWHSESMGIDSFYHLNKTNLCKEKGIKLIHIFEDEWIFKKDIVKNILKQKLNLNYNKQKIYARNCIIKEIVAKNKNEFLEKYHLQGKDSSKIKLGAFYKDELVSVMTFSKSNISRGFHKSEGVWELSRFASNFNYHITGIASKLLTYFKRNYEWKEINTFSDNRWSNGNLYYKIGFNYLYDTKPNYWYIKDFKRLHRFTLRKSKDEPKDIPEWVLRESQGYNRIWDCGNMKFSLSK